MNGFMTIWYQIIAWILPFSWAGADGALFMKHALLAVILIAPIFGLASTMIVNKGMAFFSDALGHGAFTGVVIGGLLGLMRPLWSAVIFSLIFSIAITVIKSKSKISSDTIIGVFSSVAIALGIVVSTFGGKSFTKLNNYLIGDILSITPDEIRILALLLLVEVVLWIFLFNKLLLISVNKSLAISRGFNVLAIETIFTAMIALIVTISMSLLGLLVINSFLVLPAAAART